MRSHVSRMYGPLFCDEIALISQEMMSFIILQKGTTFFEVFPNTDDKYH